jgi:integrase
MGVRRSTSKSTSKGCVSISDYKQGLRLRWNFKESRRELYIPATITNRLRVAQAIKSIIETDIISNGFDDSLQRYKSLIHKGALQESSIDSQLIYVASYVQAQKEVRPNPTNTILLKEFDNYLIAKGKSKHDLSWYYHDVIRLMQRWGQFTVEGVPTLLASEKVSNKTFNDRRNCLFKFFQWCVKRGKLSMNPLEDVANKRRNKAIDQRKPFTDSEAAAIILALKEDTFSTNKRYPHSQYWRFVAYLLHVGCRTAEAIGLRIKEVDFERREIRIAYSLSRTMKGSHVKARVLKGTKMDNVRFVPMDDHLCDLLRPMCQSRKANEFVFVNNNDNPIDDKMFQRRVFRPVLTALGIDKRDLYACRHTFATRAVQQGMKPHEVAYIMGDSVETILNNYFHNNRRPESLPKPLVIKANNLRIA